MPDRMVQLAVNVRATDPGAGESAADSVQLTRFEALVAEGDADLAAGDYVEISADQVGAFVASLRD